MPQESERKRKTIGWQNLCSERSESYAALRMTRKVLRYRVPPSGVQVSTPARNALPAGACRRSEWQTVGDDAFIVPRADEGIRPYEYNEENNPRTAKSFFVPKDEIVENGYDLSINKYKKTEYVAIEYPSTEEILDKLDALEAQIVDEMKKLRGML